MKLILNSSPQTSKRVTFQNAAFKGQIAAPSLIAKRQLKVKRTNSARTIKVQVDHGRPAPPRLTSKGIPRYHTKALMRQTRSVIEATEKDEAREVRGKF